jgi:hypothetical protein
VKVWWTSTQWPGTIRQDDLAYVAELGGFSLQWLWGELAASKGRKISVNPIWQNDDLPPQFTIWLRKPNIIVTIEKS